MAIWRNNSASHSQNLAGMFYTTLYFLFKKAYNDWQDNPVLTTVSTTAMPISEIEFPAITICGQGSVSEVPI